MILQANVSGDMEKGISGGVLSSAIHGHTDELHGLDFVWPTNGAPSQLAGGEHQWWRMRD